jgi:DNA-binding response OmpR family regulator
MMAQRVLIWLAGITSTRSCSISCCPRSIQILKTIRAERRTTPILMLTARDAPQDTIGGLNLGADDYLTKPFHVDVFVARGRAVSRRGQVAQFTNLDIGCFTSNRATHELRRQARRFSRTQREQRRDNREAKDDQQQNGKQPTQ